MSNSIAVVMLGCGNFARRYHVPTLLALVVLRLLAAINA